MERVYENKTDHLIVFSVLKDVKGERRPKWYTIRPNESVEVELDSSELQGPNSWERAELFGLTQKSGPVAVIEKKEVTPSPLFPKAPKKKKRK